MQFSSTGTSSWLSWNMFHDRCTAWFRLAGFYIKAMAAHSDFFHWWRGALCGSVPPDIPNHSEPSRSGANTLIYYYPVWDERVLELSAGSYINSWLNKDYINLDSCNSVLKLHGKVLWDNMSPIISSQHFQAPSASLRSCSIVPRLFVRCFPVRVPHLSVCWRFFHRLGCLFRCFKPATAAASTSSHAPDEGQWLGATDDGRMASAHSSHHIDSGVMNVSYWSFFFFFLFIFAFSFLGFPLFFCPALINDL